MRGERRNISERLLGLFADVREGEGMTAILLMFNLFALLTAYLVIKTVREALNQRRELTRKPAASN
jgi:hypothetical protein